MKKIFFRIIVSLITFTLGVTIAWFFYSITLQEVAKAVFTELEEPEPPIAKKPVPTSPKGEVEISVKQFVQTEAGLALEVEITNYNSRPAVYYSYSKDKMFTGVKYNDKIDVLYICLSGAENFELQAGESLTVQIKDQRFYTHLNEDGDFQIGFGFKFGEKDYKDFWSSKFRIPDEAKERLRNEMLPK